MKRMSVTIAKGLDEMSQAKYLGYQAALKFGADLWFSICTHSYISENAEFNEAVSWFSRNSRITLFYSLFCENKEARRRYVQLEVSGYRSGKELASLVVFLFDLESGDRY